MKPQANPNRLEISEEDRLKVAKLKSSKEATKVEVEWLITAEFGYYFGYAGIEAIMNNDISLEIVGKLLAGAHKIDSRKTYDNAFAMFVGGLAANSKNAQASFKKLTKDLLKDSEADK